MTPKLNTELSEALRQQTGPLEVQDDLGNDCYAIVSKEQYRKLLEHEFQEWIQEGLDDEARGDLEEWDLEAIKAEAHRRFNERHPS